MDGTSTLVLEGHTDDLPFVTVNESATVDGSLVIRLTLSPTFSSYGLWQDFTVIKCNYECSGTFQEVKVEHVGPECALIEDKQVRQRESLISIAVNFGRSQICFAPASMPQLMMLWGFVLLFSK